MDLFNERIKGGPPKGAAITGTSSVVLAANPARRYAVFVNDGSIPIYIALDDTAVMNKGIRLNANGGSYEIGFNNFYVGVVSAICASSANLCYLEG